MLTNGRRRISLVIIKETDNGLFFVVYYLARLNIGNTLGNGLAQIMPTVDLLLLFLFDLFP